MDANAQHSLLSASAAARWIACPGSAKMAAALPDRGSAYAELGTLAHALCARNLKQALGRPCRREEEEIAALSPRAGAVDLRQAERCAQEYAQRVLGLLAEARERDPRAMLLVEARVDYGDWAPGGYGTADALILSEGLVEVMDYKHGEGVRVEARENPQLMLYALGALASYGFDYEPREARLRIWQPRADNYPEWSLSVADLEGWGRWVARPAAEAALDDSPSRRLRAGGPERFRSGAHCSFCPAAAACRELSRVTSWYWRNGAMPESLGEALERVPEVERWARAVKDAAMAAAMAGEPPKGWKLVAGRSARKVTDPEGLAKAMQAAGVDDPWRPRELKTLGDLEALCGGKGAFALLSEGMVAKAEGKPSLVPADDPREALDAAQGAAAQFDGL